MIEGVNFIFPEAPEKEVEFKQIELSKVYICLLKRSGHCLLKFKRQHMLSISVASRRKNRAGRYI